MIRINIVKSNNNLEKITFKGHANYDDYGKDIVCASVSSIVTTIINCIMNIDSNSCTYEDDGKIIRIEKINENEIVDIILNTMMELFKDLESNYSKNIKIESEE